ncbi:hypothetical protein B0H13DRAFT_1918794 [Mycena leptocephala]|nr:hypothetical protein B0H13DRAFT_1918794 [Mycena leptocephala]
MLPFIFAASVLANQYISVAGVAALLYHHILTYEDKVGVHYQSLCNRGSGHLRRLRQVRVAHYAYTDPDFLAVLSGGSYSAEESHCVALSDLHLARTGVAVGVLRTVSYPTANEYKMDLRFAPINVENKFQLFSEYLLILRTIRQERCKNEAACDPKLIFAGFPRGPLEGSPSKNRRIRTKENVVHTTHPPTGIDVTPDRVVAPRTLF